MRALDICKVKTDYLDMHGFPEGTLVMLITGGTHGAWSVRKISPRGESLAWISERELEFVTSPSDLVGKAAGS